MKWAIASVTIFLISVTVALLDINKLHKQQLAASVVIHTPEPSEDPVQATSVKPCPNEGRLIVLDKIFPLVDSPADPESLEIVTERERRLKCIKDWAVGLTDPCDRQNYAQWIAYYEDKLGKFRKMFENNQHRESVMDKWDRERREENRLKAAYEKLHPVPAPPSCDREIVRKVR